MKPNIKADMKLSATSLLLLLALLFEGDARADWRPPFETEQIIGNWIGYEASGLYFYRLALNKGGKGSCVAVYHGRSYDGYRVDDWHLTGESLIIKMSPLTALAEEIQLTVASFDDLQMALTVTGVAERWQRKAILYKETEFLRGAKISGRHQANLPRKEQSGKGRKRALE